MIRSPFSFGAPLRSTAHPAAVAVHWAEGVRWVPISKGMRNCRSAVQKWLDAPTSAFSSCPPSINAEANTSPCTKVEHAPYSPRKGVFSARAQNPEAMIWSFRSPERKA